MLERAGRVTRPAVPLSHLSALLAVACGGGAPPGASSSPATADSLALEPYVGRLLTLTGRLHGDSLRLLFDSGGGETLLAPHVASAIPCTPEGRSVGFRMSGERVEWPLCHDVTLTFGDREIVDATVGIWDIAALLPEGLPRLDGVVSLETFRDHAVTLNLAGSRIVLETGRSLADRVRTMTPVPMRIATGDDGSHLTVLLEGRLRTPPTAGWFLVDSGNLSEMVLAPHLGASGDSSVTITLGDGLAVSAASRTEDIIYDGALSEAILRRLVVTLDLPTGRAWVAQVP